MKNTSKPNTLKRIKKKRNKKTISQFHKWKFKYAKLTSSKEQKPPACGMATWEKWNLSHGEMREVWERKRGEERRCAAVQGFNKQRERHENRGQWHCGGLRGWEWVRRWEGELEEMNQEEEEEEGGKGGLLNPRSKQWTPFHIIFFINIRSKMTSSKWMKQCLFINV